jgi:hypothetical protein
MKKKVSIIYIYIKVSRPSLFAGKNQVLNSHEWSFPSGGTKV